MPTDDQFERLARDVDALRRRLDAIDARLEKLESEPTATSVAKPPAADDGIEIIDASMVEEVAQPRSVQPSPQTSQQPAWKYPESARREPSALQTKLNRAQEVFAEQWEDIIGGRWMTWAGALTLIVAVAFFVPWAWTELDLPNWSKVLILHVAGAGISIAALVLHLRGMKVFAQGLAGVGIFTLYASAWAAQHHYQIWGESGLWTFIECALITALAIAAAISSRSVAIVLLGALGGYLTPIITPDWQDSHVTMFTYLAFLNVALVGSAVLRGWSFLKPLALLATMLMFAAWMLSRPFDPALPWSTQWLASAHWLIFLVGATLPPVVWKRGSNWLDLLALSTNSLWFVGVTAALFHARAEQQLALFCWGMTALHLVLFGVTYNRVTNVDRMPRVHLALAAIFFILAMPLQLEDSLNYLALAWAAQGVVLSAVGIYFRDKQMCVSSLIVFWLAGVRLMGFDYTAPPELLGGEDGLVDRRFLMFMVTSLLMIVGGALYPLAGRLLRKGEENALFWEPAGGVIMAAGNLLAMVGLTLQWDSRLILLLWTIDAAVIWAAGFALRRQGFAGREVRAYGLFLAVVMVGLRALYHADAIDIGRVPMWNDRFGTLLLMAVVYFAAAWCYRTIGLARPKEGEAKQDDFSLEQLLDPAVAVLANITLVTALSLEIHTWFEAVTAAGNRPFANMQMAEQASYSILWAVYAAIAVVLGLVLRWPVLRYIGLIGLAMTLAKVFFIDLSSLRLLARVLALAVMGGVLLAVSFIYQRFQAKLAADS